MDDEGTSNVTKFSIYCAYPDRRSSVVSMTREETQLSWEAYKMIADLKRKRYQPDPPRAAQEVD